MEQFTPTLAITGFSPSQALPATVVTVNGIGFTSTSTVKFHGVSASSVKFVSSKTLQVKVPATATTGAITVTNKLAPAGMVTSATSFTVG